jgi:hypothetical protein
MYGLQWHLGPATEGDLGSRQAELSRVAAERHAWQAAAREARRSARATSRSRSIRQRRGVSGILSRLSSRATNPV